MTISDNDLRAELAGRELPGGSIVIEPHESVIGDRALRAKDAPSDQAHPLWYVIASLRGMGISVDDLCRLAHKSEGDTLLFGSCEVVQDVALTPGAEYVTTARIGEVGSRTTRDGSRLDSVEVVVELHRDGSRAGAVTSVYLFKRGPRL
ncbi:hypothetical protein ACFVDI_21000 [Nocardioides sp. NPDC057767]|uniref:hypothetical protein n=1 Tax=unclassified Nocardioides TaxID=2615069 RepID=UPI00366C972E